jgi:hypothetical protein
MTWSQTMLRLTFVTVATFFLAGIVLTAPVEASDKHGSGAEAPKNLSFEAVRGADGKIKLKLRAEDLSNAAEMMQKKNVGVEERNDLGEIKGTNYETLTGKKFTFPEIPEWYIAIDPKGKLNAVYGVPRGESLTSEIMMKAPVGTKFLKQDSSQFAEYLSANLRSGAIKLVRDTLTEMANGAVDQVCSFKARPTKFSMDTEVEVSLGVGGKVAFSMEWDTRDLCK